MFQYCVLVTALTVTFGSLYQDEVEITHKNVVGVLAAATLFGLVCIHCVYSRLCLSTSWLYILHVSISVNF